MACPKCGHTMQNLGVEHERQFWCARCGTVKTETGGFECHESPRWFQVFEKLVKEEIVQLQRWVEQSTKAGCWSDHLVESIRRRIAELGTLLANHIR